MSLSKSLVDEYKLTTGVAAIVSEFHLTESAAEDLAETLRNLATLLNLKMDKGPGPGAIGRALHSIKGSVNQIADFERDGCIANSSPESEAYGLLLSCARSFAANADLNMLAQMGLTDRVADGLDTEYGAIEFVDGWLRQARVIRTLIAIAEMRLADRAEADKAPPVKRAPDEVPGPSDFLAVNERLIPYGPVESTPWSWALGFELPALYERLTGKRASLLKGTDGQTAADRGVIRFVRLATSAMGFEAPEPNGVRSLIYARRQAAKNKISGDETTGKSSTA